MELNSYELSRNLFDWSFENPEKINTNHIALYFFIIEHCNRLGWKEKFGLPTGMAKEAIGIRNYRTYINTLNDLIEFGFIKLIEKSKNQYSCNIIAIVKNTKAHTKALDKARSKHLQKQVQSIDSIDKQENKETSKPINNIPDSIIQLNEWSKKYFDEKFINEKSIKCFDDLVRIDNYNILDIQKAIEFARSDNFWTTNFLSPLKLRNKNRDGVKYIDVFLSKTLIPKTNGSGKQQTGAGWDEITELLKSKFAVNK